MGLLVAPVVFFGMRRWLLLSIFPRELLVVLQFVSLSTAAKTATTIDAPVPLGVDMLLVERFEFPAVIGVVGMLLMEDAVWTTVLAMLGVVLAMVFLVRFRHKDGGLLATSLDLFLAGGAVIRLKHIYNF
jgi:hypothetical protein